MIQYLVNGLELYVSDRDQEGRREAFWQSFSLSKLTTVFNVNHRHDCAKITS